ncbi:MAG: SOS response-associated peptidase [Verrucomicrobiia bacterium]
MCGRFSQAGNFDIIRKECNVSQCLVDEKPRYNIAPSQPAQVIFNENQTKCIMMKWGLVPSWAQDASIGEKLINARAESLLEKPMFKNIFKRRRCLIPSDGFYEWTKGRYKQPLRFLMKDDSPFAFGGLWDRWASPDGSVIETFAIITTTANDLVAPIHNRMPLIIRPEDYHLWLDDSVKDIKLLENLLKPFPPERMRRYKVSRMMNNPKFDSPECFKEIANDAPGLNFGSENNNL